MNPTDPATSALVTNVALALTEQAARHVDLAKAEFVADARSVGSDLLPLVVGVPLLCIGYVFLCIAAASALTLFIGTLAAGTLVGFVNVVAGAVAVRFTYVQLRGRRAHELVEEVEPPQALVLNAPRA